MSIIFLTITHKFFMILHLLLFLDSKGPHSHQDGHLTFLTKLFSHDNEYNINLNHNLTLYYRIAQWVHYYHMVIFEL